jgi:hypothetical protein
MHNVFVSVSLIIRMYDIKPWVKTVLIIFSFLDQLKGRINLNVDDMDKLTVDDLRSQVDYAISQVILQHKYLNECQGCSVKFH